MSRCLQLFRTETKIRADKSVNMYFSKKKIAINKIKISEYKA